MPYLILLQCCAVYNSFLIYLISFFLLTLSTSAIITQLFEMKLIKVKIIIFNKWIGWGLSCSSKIPRWLPTIWQILSSTFSKTLWPAYTATSSKERRIEAYSFGLSNLGKLGYSNLKKKKKTFNVCVCKKLWQFLVVVINSVPLSKLEFCHWQLLKPYYKISKHG